jgi:RNA polymerase sigma-70 factor, ECF subfamily
VDDAADHRRGPANAATGRQAYVALVDAHYARVYRFLLHLGQDATEAEDLTQETFAAAWEKLDTFGGRAEPGTWLHRIAYTKFIDARRGRARAAALVARLARETPPESQSPLDSMLAGDEARHLYAGVARLEEADRALIVLHYMQDLSYREMADVLGEPAGTVKWRTSEALRRLRRLLTPEEAPDGKQPALRERLES